MILNKFDLRFAGFLQDEAEIPLEECVERFEKSESSLKKSIYRINDHLDNGQHFLVKRNKVYSKIHRTEYENLCQSLSLENYVTIINERLMFILFNGFFNRQVNLTQLYRQLGLSQATKKKDSKQAKAFLKKMDLQMKNRYRLGIEIEGSEFNYRKYIAQKLSNIVELDKNDELKQRKANTPIQNELYTLCMDHIGPIHQSTKASIRKVLDERVLEVDYASKKFVYLYFAVSTWRIKQGNVLSNLKLIGKQLKVPSFSLFDQTNEARQMDFIMASLNYTQLLEFPFDENNHRITTNIMNKVRIEYIDSLYTTEELYNKLYAYIYKCRLLNQLDYYFYDDKLDRTYVELDTLYNLISEVVQEIEEKYKVNFSKEQLSVICLIIETVVSQNIVAGEHSKNIFIITNSSSEKVHYFTQHLKNFVEFELVDYATINELYKLNMNKWDSIIVFSSRIQALLLERGYNSLKLNFYIKSNDVKKLIDEGFYSNKNAKLIRKEIAEKMAHKTKKEIMTLLKEDYGEYFL